MNHKVNYGLIESEVQIKTRNATLCNNCDNVFQLSFILKIAIFWEAYIQPSQESVMELLLRK